MSVHFSPSPSPRGELMLCVTQGNETSLPWDTRQGVAQNSEPPTPLLGQTPPMPGSSQTTGDFIEL